MKTKFVSILIAFSAASAANAGTGVIASGKARDGRWVALYADQSYEVLCVGGRKAKGYDGVHPDTGGCWYMDDDGSVVIDWWKSKARITYPAQIFK